MLTAGGMLLVNWSLQDLSDSRSTRVAACMLVALSALLALPLWLATISLPNGLWVEYLWVYGIGHVTGTGRAYRFLPITAVPLTGLLFTTYSGQVLLMRRQPRSLVWLAANHAPLLSVFVLLFIAHRWIPAPFFNG